MARKMVKKRKLKIFPFLLILIVLGGIFFAIFLSLNTKIKNLIVTGNNYLSDEEVLQLADVSDYPSFYLTFSNSLSKRLLKSAWVKKVKIKRSFYHVLTIDIEENRPLFIKNENKKIVLENKKEITSNREVRIPVLMNYVPNTKYNTFIKKMKRIKQDVLGKVSEMEYQPNTHDKDRFLLYMDDGNMVYLTLTKFEMLNYYNEVLTQLEGRKGILYLDSGNHFKIME